MSRRIITETRDYKFYHFFFVVKEVMIVSAYSLNSLFDLRRRVGCNSIQSFGRTVTPLGCYDSIPFLPFVITLTGQGIAQASVVVISEYHTNLFNVSYQNFVKCAFCICREGKCAHVENLKVVPVKTVSCPVWQGTLTEYSCSLISIDFLIY